MLAVPSILIHKISCRELTYPYISSTKARFDMIFLFLRCASWFPCPGTGTVSALGWWHCATSTAGRFGFFGGWNQWSQLSLGKHRKFMYVGWINMDYIDIYIYSHRIHVWHVCLHLVIFCSINVGKYSSRMDPMVDHSCLLMSFLSLRTLGEEMSVRLV